jgi:DNA-binding NarL/FixJ family response regulator/signal transduction histidine kinase
MTTIGVLILILVAAGYVRAAVRRLPTDDAALWAAESGLLLLLAVATGWPALSLALTRRRVAELVVQASAVPPIGGLGRVLGEALHDPTTRLLYRRQGENDEYLIDADGNPAQPSAQLTPLIRGADTVAYLDHGEPLLDHEGAVIAQVARLSLDHERLHAERTAQLRELRESRVRIVAAADRERRRLERDLHDGGQQRLASLALGLQLAELGRTPTDGSRTGTLLSEARTEVDAALAELRAIARGLYPRELADEGLESALETVAESDPTVEALVGDQPSLERAVSLDGPDVAIVDIKMPPTHTDEGLVAAAEIRHQHPEVGVLLLSHYLDSRYAVGLLEQHSAGVGYLLKERVSNIDVLVDALQRVADGESVVDPTIVSRLMTRQRRSGRLNKLSDREREVLALMAEGMSNVRIAESLALSGKTVERHVGHIFDKLGLAESPDQHRRVLAVLAWLRGR